jgi:hypothetical protein
METTVKKKENEVRNLTVNDRCDQCDSQAYVSVTGISGELFFCGHHFTKIERNAAANEKLQAFAYVINDEREKLSDKRAGL